MIQLLLLDSVEQVILVLKWTTQAGQNKRLTRDKTVTKFVRVSSLDRRHGEYEPRETRPRFALRLHGTLTLVGSRAETGMPPGRFSVIGKGKSPVEKQRESSAL